MEWWNDDWKYLEMAKIAGNGKHIGWIWLNWLEMARMAEDGWKLLYIACTLLEILKC